MKLYKWWNHLRRQWKRKLRLKRRLLYLATLALLLGSLAAWAWATRTPGTTDDTRTWLQQRSQAVFSHTPAEAKQPEEEVRSLIRGMEGEREAFSRKTYVCGEETLRIGMLSAEEILAYYKEHPSLVVSLSEGGTVFFTESIDDLSPDCKEHAYFGLDAKGNLSMFEGIPGSGSENVLRTFFQLNIGHLESSLPRETVRQLYQGIRIRDLDDYNSVLSTLSDFAVEETEKTMGQTNQP
ncbi:forespore regulator of the sigma-K checkpoint [Paenibacillus sp. UNCCL117]|uniref:BofC C-terminal domain-containing protein n=1 Tax=unclassified Paenibacillus TaxID=185978 RepID=UPI0008865E22|nr:MULTISPECIES: BofC C-terminal domain-containing protein [unclassified Paenibacillus]SDE59949.1 forespore regulator of the sigma-K checkpoint [Paenibacillus sp. cl123]SFW69399.1 forespore regulator of the sigma-K checkpoint [Paenibacillus sp. UNCCL117]